MNASVQLPIYLDYAATTPVDPRVAEKMGLYLTKEGCFGNPASNTHAYGWQAAEVVHKARCQVAQLINANPGEMIFTSGATESNNLAIIGAARFYKNKGKHIITVKTEHKAVLDSCRYLSRSGFNVTYLTPDKNGLISLEQLSQAIQDDTVLVSIMHVNNETGVVQNIAEFGQLLASKNIFFHVDAAQSAGKLPIDVGAMQVDLLSLSAHKMYGPKGIGALYVRQKPKVRLEPLIHGGGHEQGLRSGTLATHQIVGMGEACLLAKQEMPEEAIRIKKLRDHLWQGLSELDDIILNSYLPQCSPAHLNISVKGVEGEALILGLQDIAVSSGSACNSVTIEPSYVLSAMGIPAELAHSALRFSMGRFTTEEEINFTVDYLKKQIKRLRDLAP